MQLEGGEFLRRFLLHTLPPGFQRIRHFGLFSNRHRQQALAVCRQLLATPVVQLLPRPEDFRQLYEALTGVSLRICPQCHRGTMRVIEILPPLRYQPVAIGDSS